METSSFTSQTSDYFLDFVQKMLFQFQTQNQFPTEPIAYPGGQITHRDRYQYIQVIYEKFIKLAPEVLELTVLLLDRFCRFQCIERRQFPLVVMVSLMLAIKMKGDGAISLPRVSEYLENKVDVLEVMSAELEVIQQLNYDLDMVTPYEGSVILLEKFLKSQAIDERHLYKDLKEIQKNILLDPRLAGFPCLLQSIAGCSAWLFLNNRESQLNAFYSFVTQFLAIKNNWEDIEFIFQESIIIQTGGYSPCKKIEMEDGCSRHHASEIGLSSLTRERSPERNCYNGDSLISTGLNSVSPDNYKAGKMQTHSEPEYQTSPFKVE